MKFIPTFLTSALFLFATLISNAQEKEQRIVSNFTKIEVSSGINLYLTQGDEIQLSVEADKSEMHKIITEVSNNTLKIYNKRNYMWGIKQAPKVYLTITQLSEIIAGGGADVYGQKVINSSKIKVSTSGGADAYLEIVANEIILSTSGGSDIRIKGTTDILTASASGGSDINAGALKAQKVMVSTSGGADAKVWVEKELTAKASGGSDIDYFGNPEVKNIIESGGGDITQR